MAVSERLLKLGLYREHLEEATFLYEQCLNLRRARGSSWLKLGDFEQRLEAHIDALRLGGQMALNLCFESAQSGDGAELFATVALICHHQSLTLLGSIVNELASRSPAHQTALRDALAWQLPEAWVERCVQAVQAGQPASRSMFAEVLACRRADCPSGAKALLESAQGRDLHAALWAIGRWRRPQDQCLVRRFYAVDDLAVCASALHAGLRLQDAEAGAMVDRHEAPSLALGLAASRGAVVTLGRRLSEATSARESALALGLLGELSAVRPLLAMLSDEEVGGDAAQALHIITGAPLFERVFVAETMAQDEMFEQEWTHFSATGEAPSRVDGRHFGENALRLTRDPAVWERWLRTHASRFSAGPRYRLGRLCSPAVIALALTSDDIAAPLRGHFLEELVIRYDIDLEIEPVQFVAEQRRRLRSAIRKVLGSTTRFEPGHWYRAGQLLA